MSDWIVGRWLAQRMPQHKYRQDIDSKWSIVSGFSVLTFNSSDIGQSGQGIQGVFEEVFTNDGLESITCREYAIYKSSHLIVSRNNSAFQVTIKITETQRIEWGCGRGTGVSPTVTGMQYRATPEGMVLENMNGDAHAVYKRISI